MKGAFPLEDDFVEALLFLGVGGDGDVLCFRGELDVGATWLDAVLGVKGLHLVDNVLRQRQCDDGWISHEGSVAPKRDRFHEGTRNSHARVNIPI